MAVQDIGSAETDALIEKMEKRINNVYSSVEKETKKKLNGFMREYNAQNKALQAGVKAGTVAQETYEKWLKSQAVKKKWLEEMVNTISADHVSADIKAMSIVRGFLPEAYAINRNFGAFQVEKGSLLDTSFTLYDRHTVENLIQNRPNLLPAPSPDIPKDMRWNSQRITNAITHGILEGESIPDISKRLQEVTTMDRNAAVRNARTAVTGAQNAGRVDSYKYAQTLGISLKQEWLSTLDGRTRESHRLLDGEQIKVGGTFSNGCRYPGDPHGAPEEIYNCRCTLVAAVKGVDQSDAPRNSKLEDMTYDEWKYEKGGEESKLRYNLRKAENELGQFENKTYSGIWPYDVSVTDYKSKIDSIAAKEEYYNRKLEHFQNERKLSQEEGDKDGVKYWDNRIAEVEANIANLKDFKQRGEEYLAMQQQVADAKKELNAYIKQNGVSQSPFTTDAYSQSRKNSAFMFDSRNDADKLLRPQLDAQWENLEDLEKYGVWKYTENSNPMNKPLSGYEDSWSRRNFKGVGNANWQSEDGWRKNSDEFKPFGHEDGRVDHAAAISGLTNAIDKCPLEQDMWFFRGDDIGGLAGLLEGNVISFEDAKRLLESGDIDTLKKIVEGQVFQNHAFLSTGIAKDAGFLGKAVSVELYAPQGTRCIYAEPQSFYGETLGMQSSRLYRPGDRYTSVGYEAEQIFQRGSSYRIKTIDMPVYGRYDVSMEVVEQPDYFRTGYEQTANNGATSFSPKK